MLVHQSGLTWLYFDLVNIYERVLKDEVMMRFLNNRHARQGRDGLRSHFMRVLGKPKQARRKNKDARSLHQSCPFHSRLTDLVTKTYRGSELISSPPRALMQELASRP